MNDKRQITFKCPTYLLFESLQLFLLIGLIPIQVEPNLTNSDKRMDIKQRF